MSLLEVKEDVEKTAIELMKLEPAYVVHFIDLIYSRTRARGRIEKVRNAFVHRICGEEKEAFDFEALKKEFGSDLASFDYHWPPLSPILSTAEIDYLKAKTAIYLIAFVKEKVLYGMHMDRYLKKNKYGQLKLSTEVLTRCIEAVELDLTSLQEYLDMELDFMDKKAQNKTFYMWKEAFVSEETHKLCPKEFIDLIVSDTPPVPKKYTMPMLETVRKFELKRQIKEECAYESFSCRTAVERERQKTWDDFYNRYYNKNRHQMTAGLETFFSWRYTVPSERQEGLGNHLKHIQEYFKIRRFMKYYDEDFRKSQTRKIQKLLSSFPLVNLMVVLVKDYELAFETTIDLSPYAAIL